MPPTEDRPRLGRLRTMPSSVVGAAVAASLTLFALATPGWAQAAFDISVFARVPDPGFVALTAIGPDHTVYGASYHSFAGNAGDGTPSKLFAWAPNGTLEKTWTIAGEDLEVDHGVQAAATDGDGRVVLLETSHARVLLFDPDTGRQTQYAEIPDVPSCQPGQDPVVASCSATTSDDAPDPDYAAFGPDGTLYVDDTQQATVFSVPPGDGKARVWLSDTRSIPRASG